MKKHIFLICLLFVLGMGTSNAQYSDLLNFNGANGEYPFGSLTLSGNRLYGVTMYGGANYDGCIFSIDTNGNGYKDLLDFNDTNGQWPQSSLIISGSKLYGMAERGGLIGGGLIFSIDTNGSGFKDIWDFGDTAFFTPNLNGGGPTAPLMLSGGKLYGMTEFGGQYQWGNIFSIDTNGRDYKDLLDFMTSNGAFPEYCGLIISGNKLYGAAASGGPNNVGLVFSIDTNGSGYRVLHDFDDTTAAYPCGSLTLLEGNLYGTTQYGGLHGSGCIFSVDTNGSRYKDLFDFDTASGGNSLCTLLPSQGLLYGATWGGGGNDYGCIYSIDTNGSGYKRLYNFDSTTEACLSVGGSLTLSGNVFYGTAAFGGTNDSGIVFSFRNNNNSNLGVNHVTTTGSINVYPNPSNGMFNLEMRNEELGMNNRVEIYNMLGEKVCSQFVIPNSQFLINLSSQPNGVYLYRVVTEDGSLLGEGKVIVQK